MEELQQAAFEMIAIIGQAKSYFFDAVSLARENKMKDAEQTLQMGN